VREQGCQRDSNNSSGGAQGKRPKLIRRVGWKIDVGVGQQNLFSFLVWETCCLCGKAGGGQRLGPGGERKGTDPHTTIEEDGAVGEVEELRGFRSGIYQTRKRAGGEV